MYAIFDGTHVNGGCCFDYGNAERNSRNNGNGTMEAIYFGTSRVWGTGTGNGPWIMADLENGLFSGVNQHYNAGDPTIKTMRYLIPALQDFGEAGAGRQLQPGRDQHIGGLIGTDQRQHELVLPSCLAKHQRLAERGGGLLD